MSNLGNIEGIQVTQKLHSQQEWVHWARGCFPETNCCLGVGQWGIPDLPGEEEASEELQRWWWGRVWSWSWSRRCWLWDCKGQEGWYTKLYITDEVLAYDVPILFADRVTEGLDGIYRHNRLDRFDHERFFHALKQKNDYKIRFDGWNLNYSVA